MRTSLTRFICGGRNDSIGRISHRDSGGVAVIATDSRRVHVFNAGKPAAGYGKSSLVRHRSMHRLTDDGIMASLGSVNVFEVLDMLADILEQRVEHLERHPILTVVAALELERLQLCGIWQSAEIENGVPRRPKAPGYAYFEVLHRVRMSREVASRAGAKEEVQAGHRIEEAQEIPYKISQCLPNV